MPTRKNPLPRNNSRLGLVDGERPERKPEPLAPKSSAIPKSKKPDAIEEED